MHSAADFGFPAGSIGAGTVSGSPSSWHARRASYQAPALLSLEHDFDAGRQHYDGHRMSESALGAYLLPDGFDRELFSLIEPGVDVARRWKAAP
jgi:hypothetical protein